MRSHSHYLHLTYSVLNFSVTNLRNMPFFWEPNPTFDKGLLYMVDIHSTLYDIYEYLYMYIVIFIKSAQVSAVVDLKR